MDDNTLPPPSGGKSRGLGDWLKIGGLIFLGLLALYVAFWVFVFGAIAVIVIAAGVKLKLWLTSQGILNDGVSDKEGATSSALNTIDVDYQDVTKEDEDRLPR